MSDPGNQIAPLKTLRLKRHWSIRELSRRANVSVDALRRAEAGSKVWEVTAHKIADALGVSTQEIAEFSSRSGPYPVSEEG